MSTSPDGKTTSVSALENAGSPPAKRRLPEMVYKYREPCLKILGYILIDNELWAAKPDTLNDPFDCLPYIDLSGSYDEARAYIDLRIERGATWISQQDRHEMATEIASRGLEAVFGEGDASGDVASNLWDQSVNTWGVLSLSEDCDDILMWSHYAKHHKGVCLEFSTEAAPLGVIAPVQYPYDRPIFRPLDPDRTGLTERILTHKAALWKYEREWRYFSVREGPGKVPFPPSALKSIILGAGIEKEFEGRLREMLDSRKMQVLIRRARFDEREYRLHVE